MDQVEYASNPIAPTSSYARHDEIYQKLSNSDFRRLIMIPKPRISSDPLEPDTVRLQSVRSDARSRPEMPDDQSSKGKQKVLHKRRYISRQRKPPNKAEDEDVSTYRDRAKERREGKLSSHVEGIDDVGDERDGEQDDLLMRTANYRAVAPTTAAEATHAERRRMIIQESKYLGGDMEHTHLVKGLDFVLLQKVRMEIENKEREAETLLDEELQKPLEKKDVTEDGPRFRTKLAAGIYDVIFKNNLPERNEYFQPGRMAYRVDLEDELAEFDVPATVIRSKADCPYMDLASGAVMTTNDIVINKLTQIFSYMRAGRRQAKKAKAKQRAGLSDYNTENSVDRPEQKKKNPVASVPIFADAPSEYVSMPPPRSTNQSESVSRNRVSHDAHIDADRHKRRHHKYPDNTNTDASGQLQSRYFEKPEVESVNAPGGPVDGSLTATKEYVRELASKFGVKFDEKAKDHASLDRLLKKTEISGYDECYPGFAESYDAMGDSDDEADFSKMDLGNKKGPIGRWDFETQEEYGEYMSNKEAMPKAAFQYGVKMAEGRKTRRVGQRNEKAELDRQWQRIQSLINKRKQMSEDGSILQAKKPRY